MILNRILKAKAEEVARRKQTVPPTDMRGRAEASSANKLPGPPRSLFDALTADDEVNIIAEVKRRSPSKGALREHINPKELAEKYASGGAAAVSVLTDEPFFGGTLDDLHAARRAVAMPILRKDFIIDKYQIDEARAWGADAILLIVAALDDEQLTQFLAYSRKLQMDALVEVHTETELSRALAAGARIVGINNRNLHTFETTLDVSLRLARHVPSDVVLVSESGIRTRDDVSRLAEAGVKAILVGESFVRSAEPNIAVRSLAGVTYKRRGAAVPIS